MGKESINERCFVIMPFGGWFDRYYEEIYGPAIEEAGLSLGRPILQKTMTGK